MAYMITAIMTGGVAALISLLTGGGFLQVIWNYMLYGHLGMATLALAVIVGTILDRGSASDA